MVEIIKVELSAVLYRSNYRQQYDWPFVESTAGNMAEHGFNPTYPMECYSNGDGTYTVLDGNTRWNAAQLAQVYDIKTRQAVPFMVWIAVTDKPANDGELVLRQMEANKARRDTDPISDGMGYKRALDAGIPLADIARRAHTTIPAVNNRMALLTLAPDIQELVIKGHLPLTFAAAMANLDTNRQHIALMAYNKAKSPNINDFKDKCGELYTAQVAESQLGLFALYTSDEIAAQSDAMAESISSEPKLTVKALSEQLAAEQKARLRDRAYAKAKYTEAQNEIAKLKAELYSKGLAA